MMIIVSAVLVALAAVLLVLAFAVSGLGWLYGAIVFAVLGLVVLAVGAFRNRPSVTPEPARTDATLDADSQGLADN